MWHASAAAIKGHPASAEFLRQRAIDALIGVGNPALGQWGDWSGYAYHIRRRLTPEEQARVGGVKDIRGTPEAEKRRKAVQRYLPPEFKDWKE